MSKEFLRVSELNQLIQDVLRRGFPQPVWVCGEIQGYNRNRGKRHIFFELAEKDPGSKDIIAKIGLVLFAGKKSYIEEILQKSENAFLLKDDIEVKFACSIDFYPPHGAVRLIVESIDPTYTLGRLAQEKQKLIALLQKSGTLEKNKQLDLSPAPLNIGLITADDSAAYNDFYSELRKSGYGFKVYLRNALMQGKGAEKDICTAIVELSKILALDLIVITRGGGSIADLSCFDSRMIAEQIAACRLPVLSGIGHEINITVTDMAAHTYAKTPTAIAQWIVQRVSDFLGELDEKKSRIIDGVHAQIETQHNRLKTDALGLQAATQVFLKGHNEEIIRLREMFTHRPLVILKNSRKSLQEAGLVLRKSAKNSLTVNRTKLSSYQKMIDIVHPANTIRRGFSITRNGDGKILKSVQSVNRQDGISTELADGRIISTVDRIQTIK